MKNILCYGDSNTWGNIAGSMNVKLRLAKRFEWHERWPGVLQNLLGNDFHIIEAALNGRTTAFDETSINRPSRNGLKTLLGIMDMHYPLDLVIFMLGTNDVKVEFKKSPEEIKEGMRQLILTVKNTHMGANFEAPQILLIAPAPIMKINSEMFNLFYNEESVNTSKQLAKQYEILAREEKCLFLDAGQFVKISPIDGVHIDLESHIHLAKAIEKEINKIK